MKNIPRLPTLLRAASTRIIVAEAIHYDIPELNFPRKSGDVMCSGCGFSLGSVFGFGSGF